MRNTRYTLILIAGAGTVYVTAAQAGEHETITRHAELRLGYRPAAPVITDEIKSLMAEKKLERGNESGLTKTAPKADAITELAGVKNWPAQNVYDQGNLGSCTANAMAFTIRYLSIINSSSPSVLLNNPQELKISRLYQYYNTRYYEGIMYADRSNVTNDTGASMCGSILAIDKFGCCPENAGLSEETINQPDLAGRFTYAGYPYDTRVFAMQPDPESYRMALDPNLYGLNRDSQFATRFINNPYAAVAQQLDYRDITGKFRKSDPQTLNSPAEQNLFKQAVIQSLGRNHPVYIGVLLDDTFMNDQRGYIPMPPLQNFNPTGGHAITVVGYGPYNAQNPKANYFKFINSWGSSWGDKGFGYLPEAYLTNVNKYYVEGFEVWLNRTA